MAKKIQYTEIKKEKEMLPAVLKIFDLTGKVAIVTGASSGLGREMATGLALAGASVMFVARREEPLKEAVARLDGFDVSWFSADVTKTEDVEKMVAAAMERYGKIDILINNAGTTFRSPLEEFPDEEYDRVINTNMRSCFLCTKYVGQEMLKNGKGSIINIGSGAGGHAIKNSAAYCTSKGGMVMMTKAAAADWATKGIRVNIIMPGTFYTPLLQACIDKEPDYEEMILKGHPMGRVGQPTEIVGIAIYLASDNSTFMTGNVVYLDSGAHAV